MIARITAYLSKQHRTSIPTAGLLLVVVLSLLDFASGYELSFAIFYLGPIALTVKVLRGLIPICAWCKKVRAIKGTGNKQGLYY